MQNKHLPILYSTPFSMTLFQTVTMDKPDKVDKTRMGLETGEMLPTLRLVEARHGDSLKGSEGDQLMAERDRLLMARLGTKATIQVRLLYILHVCA